MVFTMQNINGGDRLENYSFVLAREISVLLSGTSRDRDEKLGEWVTYISKQNVWHLVHQIRQQIALKNSARQFWIIMQYTPKVKVKLPVDMSCVFHGCVSRQCIYHLQPRCTGSLNILILIIFAATPLSSFAIVNTDLYNPSLLHNSTE